MINISDEEPKSFKERYDNIRIMKSAVGGFTKHQRDKLKVSYI